MNYNLQRDVYTKAHVLTLLANILMKAEFIELTLLESLYFCSCGPLSSGYVFKEIPLRVNRHGGRNVLQNSSEGVNETFDTPVRI
jgi:hypothetical protein